MILLEIHERNAHQIKQAFKKPDYFTHCANKAAMVFINRNPVTMKNKKHNEGKTPELLARCCDGILKKNNSHLKETEIDALLDKMATIFRFLEDKDIFLKFYTRLLSKRLIDESSVSEETESDFIRRLSDICGFDYTTHLTQMIIDATASKDLNKEFKEEAEDQFSTEKLPSFNTLVIKSCSWPSMPSISVSLPLKISRSIELFSKFYMEKHNGRKLTWALGQSKGEIAANFTDSQKIFKANCPQIVTLLLFNDRISYTFGELVSATGMDQKNVTMVVATLIKGELLTRVNNVSTAEYDENEKFEFNLYYITKKTKIDLTRLAVRPADVKEGEDGETLRFLKEDRMVVIQACIVRILKENKTMNHQQLMLEVLKEVSTRFKPRVDMIKKCTAILIEKEYIRRSEKARDVYEYIA